MQKHKWYNEIVAWAGGAEIEVYNNGIWESVQNPWWIVDNEYRIKPQPKEPQYLYVYVKSNGEIIFAERQVDTVHKMRGKIKLEQDDE